MNTIRPNKYAGKCEDCGQRVDAMAGSLTSGPRGWEVRHANGCPPVAATTPIPRPFTADVPAGHYAVESATGNNDLDFYRVDRPEDGRWAGYTFVKRVIGGHPDTPVRGREAHSALDRIKNAPRYVNDGEDRYGWEAAAIRYGVEIGRCYRCNRSLTDETSRALGIGPDCRSRG